MPEPIYDESTIKSLDWKEHIRTRPGMYIGKLGDGSSHDDGIYILLKEVLDNCIDEFVMGHGKSIDIKVSDTKVNIRDYGRGIPLTKVHDCVSKINTGGKYDTEAFTKSVGLNGVGLKAVNALSNAFTVQSVREGKMKLIDYSTGDLVQDNKIEDSSLRNGTKVVFSPDPQIFKNFHFLPEYIEDQIWNYVYLNSGLNINFNGEKYFSENGLKDLLERKTDVEKIRYSVIHLKGEDIEIALTHGDQYGEEYYSFVNGQHTTQGGTHLAAFREAIVRTLREFYKKDFDASDIRASIIGSISLRIQNPIFESQTKTRLGSIDMGGEGPTVRIFINDFIKRELDNFLHKNTSIAEDLLKRIMLSERERKDMAGVKKLANQRAKKANLHNKKLRDCKVHLNDDKVDDEKRLNSTIFITEGDSASGSITKSRNVSTQAVFSLRGKPLNSFGMKKKVVYENEEFNLLHHALNIEEGLDNLRYNQVVIATDADVDGMHIRLLILTFFLQFFPDLVKNGHIYILETPLFRVRNKKETLYCYSETEKKDSLRTLGGKAEITRFKGLGEISPEEFGLFIGDSMRLEPVIIRGKTSVKDLLRYYMGKNTEDRQKFIIDNLRLNDEELENQNV